MNFLDDPQNMSNTFEIGATSQVRFTEDQVEEEGNEGGCLIRKAQHKKVHNRMLPETTKLLL